MKKCSFCGKDILDGKRKKIHTICSKRKWSYNNKEKKKEYYLNNKEYIINKSKEWALNNPEKIIEIKRRWDLKNRPRKGINDGGFKKGHKHSKETLKKIIEANLGNKNHLGKHHSEETKKKFSIMRKGIKHSEETKKLISKSNIGKICSEETKRKISLANSGKKRTEEERKKMSICHIGEKHSKEQIEKQRISMKGKNTWRKYQVLPVKDTKIEVKIQNFLKQLNIDFLTHQYIKDIEHGYQCDILIPSMNLVIECDGDYWHKYPIGNEIDHIRTSELLEKGFKVLRLWEFEIKKMELNEFREKIIC